MRMIGILRALSATDHSVTMVMAKCRHCQCVTLLYAAADIFEDLRERIA